MKDPIYTEKEINEFLQNADFDIINDLHESQMIEEDITFDQFLQKYNERVILKTK